MSRPAAERMWQLLPAVYRQRDAELGGPLEALLAVLGREAEVVEDDLHRLLDNWFIETCDEWLVPYLGDLIGVTGVQPTPGARFSRRAEVANTLGYRRRKGTAAVLEQLARDVTGWPARVAEYFELLAATQHLNHVRPAARVAPDLRRVEALEKLDGPFDAAAHTLEVRRIAVRRGRYNIPNVGLWVFRRTAYPLALVEARAADASGRRFHFSPLGHDTLLFRHPATETSPSHIAEEVNAPVPIRRRALHLRPEDDYPGSLAIHRRVDGRWESLERELIVACDLGDFERPVPAGRVAVDPLRGRLAFGSDPPDPFRVSYHYGFSDDVGGGQYDRRSALEGGGEPLRVGESPGAFGTIGEALAARGTGSAVIEIEDSRTYEETPAIAIDPEARLTLRAANRQRPVLRLGATLEVHGGAGSAFELDGLLVEGAPLRVGGELDRLVLRHVTLVPGRRLAVDGAPLEPGEPSLLVESDAAEARVDRSILGAVRAAAAAEVELSDSIVDAQDPGATAFAGDDGVEAGGRLVAARVTVVGRVHTRELARADDSLFLGPVIAERRQQGCVRFCHVPLGSRVPRRYRCQPAVPAEATPAEAARLAARVFPRFRSLDYGDPDYCRLHREGPAEILTGAESESEMGVFSGLLQAQREAALVLRLEEYLRAGLESGPLFADG